MSYIGALLGGGGLVSIEPIGGGAGVRDGVLKPFILRASMGVVPGRGEPADPADVELCKIGGEAWYGVWEI